MRLSDGRRLCLGLRLPPEYRVPDLAENTHCASSLACLARRISGCNGSVPDANPELERWDVLQVVADLSPNANGMF
jgi:hypothetical protein